MKEGLLETENNFQKFLSIPPTGPLNGYLVLEIGGNISGPIAAEDLARQGAQVIKVEMSGGDPARSYLSKEIFSSCNAAKASITIDKNSQKDMITYQNLLLLSQIIIDNRSPAAKQRDNALQDFLTSSKKNPVIYCSIVGYDSEENCNRPALDVAVQAEIGMAMVNAPTPNFPLKVGFVVIDFTTGIQAASAIKDHLLALEKNRLKLNTNKVIFIEQSMAKTGAFLLTGQYLNVYTQHKESFREGNRDQWIAPFSLYKTRNGMIALAIIGDPLFAHFCDKVLNQRSFSEKYPTNQQRLKNIIAFEKELSELLLQKNAEEWLALCQQYGIVCAKVNSITDMLTQPFASKFFSTTRSGIPIIANTSSSSAYPNGAIHDAPKLNEHNNAIKTLIAKGEYFSTIYQNFEITKSIQNMSITPVLHRYNLTVNKTGGTSYAGDTEDIVYDEDAQSYCQDKNFKAKL